MTISTHETKRDDGVRRALAAWECRETDPKRAIREARELLDERPGAAASGLALAAIAVANTRGHQLEEARAAAAQVPQLMAEEPAGDPPFVASVLIEVLLVELRAAFTVGDLQGGTRAGLKAVRLAEEHALHELRARAERYTGALLGAHHLTNAALKYMRDGLRTLEEHSLPVPAALFNNLGNVYMEGGMPAEAHGFYARARREFLAAGEDEQASVARSNEGRALLRLGRYQEALEALEEGLALLSDPNSPYYPSALAKAARGHAATGDHEAAERRFKEALGASRGEAGPRAFAEEVHRWYGEWLLTRGRAAEALTQYRAALEAARARCASGLKPELLKGKAAALAKVGRYEEAYQALEQHLAERSRLEAEGERAHVALHIIELESGVSGHHELNVLSLQAVRDANRELKERAQHLEDLSVTDDLTNLYNRRYFRVHLLEGGSLALARGESVSVILLDIDRFKQVNDRYSHAVGDRVLQEVAGVLRGAVRNQDAVARWGGEEFAVLLPGFTLPGARAVAERIRSAVERHQWAHLHPELTLTISAGVAASTEAAVEYVGRAPTASDSQARHETLLEKLVELADARLYDAKRSGRNRVAP